MYFSRNFRYIYAAYLDEKARKHSSEGRSNTVIPSNHAEEQHKRTPGRSTRTRIPNSCIYDGTVGCPCWAVRFGFQPCGLRGVRDITKLGVYHWDHHGWNTTTNLTRYSYFSSFTSFPSSRPPLAASKFLTMGIRTAILGCSAIVPG